MNILDYQNFYLVGIKGVGMTTLARLLYDAGKTIYGSDVAADFVTKNTLEDMSVHIEAGFDNPIPDTTDCVIYTAAHNGELNPQVIAAKTHNLAVLSHAEALGSLFNQKKGIAVCGVGGKSTTSAMLAWIFEKTNRDISYAVGVAEINGLAHTGKWSDTSQYFIAEADEYVTNPASAREGKQINPRFFYLKPHITITKKIVWDHPDVYRDLNHTKSVFNQFFNQINEKGTLILPQEERNGDITTSAQFIWDYGSNHPATFITKFDTGKSINGKTVGNISEPVSNKKYDIELQVPGEFNFDNAVAAIIGAYAAKVPLQESIDALKTFKSTKRRFENIGSHNGIICYDDYAHHPIEVSEAIKALKQWYPNKRKVVVFQPHTYSRTRELFDAFAQALATADEIILTDIFASAREEADPSVSSKKLSETVSQLSSNTTVHYAPTLEETAKLLRELLEPGNVCLTLGAGDIYQLYNML